MGYRVKRLPYKIRPWKIQYRTWVGGVCKDRDIPDTEYSNIGVSSSLTFEQAKERCDSLNAQEHLKRVQEKRNDISKRIQIEELKQSAFLPKSLVDRFESGLESDKTQSHWRAAKRVICSLQIEPQDWSFYKDKFYKEFVKMGYGYSYCQKVLILLNKWGGFVSRERRSYFEPIPFPKYRDKEVIIDAHGQSYESKPLTPELLLSTESRFRVDNYNWLYLSLWLGLRPNEVDRLKEQGSKYTWYLEDNVIWVYQSKLVGISKDKRVKPIPLKYNEQSTCISIIESKNFKRPLGKTLQRHLGDGYTLYAGRKGFTDLMLSRGNGLEAVSQWLGHSSIETTWKVYKYKKKVLL